MQSLGSALERIRSAGEALPDDSQCQVCGYFDITHPDVRRILLDRDPTERVLQSARCRCQGIAEEKARTDQFRINQAALPTGGIPRTFQTFIERPGTGKMLEAARLFASGQGPKMLILVGQTGTGKSHLLEAIGRHALDCGRTVRYDLASTFLNRLRHTYDSDAGEDVHDLTAWYQFRHTVLLDDIGIEAATPWVREQLTTTIEERLHSGGWLAMATNLTKEALASRMGDRLASRLYAGNPDLPEVALVYNTAEDYRK